MNISCFLIEPWQEFLLKKEFKENDLNIFSEPLNLVNINQIKNTEIIVSRAKFLNLKFNKETLEQLPNLKFISTMSTGFDYIDLNYCNEKGILVSNVPSYGETSVAEQVFALLLSITRKIPQSISALKNNSINPNELESLDLSNKTLGVIGSGKIGLSVIKIAKAFEINVIAYDIIHNYEAAEKLKFKYLTLEELLKTSDIITIHAPLNKHTFHLLNKENLKFLKSNAILINTARGELINTFDLIDLLKNNPDASAGLDVFEGECDNLNSNCKELQELLKLPNIIITPHNASNTRKSKHKILQTTINNIKDFIKGNPSNLVKNI